jgi:transposase
MITPNEFYAAILGIRTPWSVGGVDVREADQAVYVDLVIETGASMACPKCGQAAPGYDAKERIWRHLDSCQFKTFLRARVPRVTCAEHGVVQVHVPWAEPGARFTELFETKVICCLLEASIQGTGRILDVGWDPIAGIQSRAIKRGLSRRKQVPVSRLGIDEVAYRKRHNYLTIVSDLDGPVLDVFFERRKESLDRFFQGLSPEQKQSIKAVAIDMWEPYIQSIHENVLAAEFKICFDKFHVASHLGKAVNDVRIEEHRDLMAAGDTTLKGTKFLWLRNPENMTQDTWKPFSVLKDRSLKVARAWSVKETAMQLWNYSYRTNAVKAWRQWIRWALRSSLKPVVKVAKMVRDHLQGILNAVMLRVTNARAEGFNSKIQWIKRIAWGFRNKHRFRNAILFHLGDLDMSPNRS